jgi:hypothetical protein
VTFCTDGTAEMVSAYSYHLTYPGYYASYIASVYAGAFTQVSLVPTGNGPDGSVDPGVTIEGSEMRLPTGGRSVFLEFRIGDWDPDETRSGAAGQLRSYEIRIDASHYRSYDGLGWEPARADCIADADCTEALGEGASCQQFASCPQYYPCECTPLFIDSARQGPHPFVFQEGASCSVDPVWRLGCSALAAEGEPDPVPFPPGGLYGGTLVVDIPDDVLGTVTIMPRPFMRAQMRYANGEDVPLVGFVPARITVLDCNGNEVPDGDDVAAGTSGDCNDNVVPDECEPNCNHNEFPDACDLSAGRSLDCNRNVVPDECDVADGTSADCNGNVVPDDCDVREETSRDLDGNGVPDECQNAVCGDGVCHESKECATCLADCGPPAPGEVPFRTCADGRDNDCDGEPDCRDADCATACSPVPAISHWGLVVLALSLAAMARIRWRRHAV